MWSYEYQLTSLISVSWNFPFWSSEVTLFPPPCPSLVVGSCFQDWKRCTAMGPCCVPSVARYCVAQNGTLLPVYINMPLSMMRAGGLGASPEGFFPGTAASGKCCRSCCVRKCCRSYRPRSCPYRYWGVSFSHRCRVVACYWGVGFLVHLRLPAGIVTFVTSSSTHVERCSLTSTQGFLWLTCITRVLLPSQWDLADPGGPAGTSFPGSAASGKVLPVLLYPEVLPFLPSQAMSLLLLGSEMSSSCTWLILLYMAHFSRWQRPHATPPPNVHCPLVVLVYQVSHFGMSVPCSSFSLGSARGLPDRVAFFDNLLHWLKATRALKYII